MKTFIITLALLFEISANSVCTQKIIPPGPLDNSETKLDHGENQKLNRETSDPVLPYKFKFFNDCQLLKREHYTLPENYKSKYVKLTNGQTYTGTIHGIIFWDNYYKITITTENSNIPEDNITALALDQDDQLWIGTNSSGIVIGTGHSVKPFKTEHVQTRHQNINSISVDAAGLVWVVYKNGSVECFLSGISCTYFPNKPNKCCVFKRPDTDGINNQEPIHLP